MEFLTTTQAAERIGCKVRYLLQAERAGRLTPYRTLGGHRRYRSDQLHVIRDALYRRPAGVPTECPETE